jgi:hypothetical protein
LTSVATWFTQALALVELLPVLVLAELVLEPPEAVFVGDELPHAARQIAATTIARTAPNPRLSPILPECDVRPAS